jgi:hypothetical protein
LAFLLFDLAFLSQLLTFLFFLLYVVEDVLQLLLVLGEPAVFYERHAVLEVDVPPHLGVFELLGWANP